MTGDMRRDSELGALMPMMYQNHRRSSITNANDTVEIRQYMDAAMGTGGGQGQGQGQEARVRRESIVHIGPLVTPSGKVVSKRLSVAMNRAMDERADRSPAKGQGQAKFKGHPNAKKFSIRVRNPGDKKDAKKNATSGPLDPVRIGLGTAVCASARGARRATWSDVRCSAFPCVDHRRRCTTFAARSRVTIRTRSHNRRASRTPCSSRLFCSAARWFTSPCDRGQVGPSSVPSSS